MSARRLPRAKPSRPRPSGVKVTMTKGGFRLKAFGPSAPDLRTVIPEILGAAPRPRPKPTSGD